MSVQESKSVSEVVFCWYCHFVSVPLPVTEAERVSFLPLPAPDVAFCATLVQSLLPVGLVRLCHHAAVCPVRVISLTLVASSATVDVVKPMSAILSALWQLAALYTVQVYLMRAWDGYRTLYAPSRNSECPCPRLLSRTPASDTGAGEPRRRAPGAVAGPGPDRRTDTTTPRRARVDTGVQPALVEDSMPRHRAGCTSCGPAARPDSGAPSSGDGSRAVPAARPRSPGR